MGATLPCQSHNQGLRALFKRGQFFRGRRRRKREVFEGWALADLSVIFDGEEGKANCSSSSFLRAIFIDCSSNSSNFFLPSVVCKAGGNELLLGWMERGKTTEKFKD